MAYRSVTVASRLAVLDMTERARAETGMRLKNLSHLVECLMRGFNIEQTSRQTGATRKTTAKLFRALGDVVKPCGCGRPVTHSGWCAHRLEHRGMTPDHVNAGRQRATMQRARHARTLATIEERHALVVAVNALVPRFFNDDLRGELTQETFLAIAEGRMTLADVKAHMPELIKRAHYGLSQGWLASLDAETFEDHTLYDQLADDSDRIWEETDEWDRDTHCFGCGERGFIRRIHGHWQCGECGCIVQTCCDI